jgi:hypothetical protein
MVGTHRTRRGLIAMVAMLAAAATLVPATSASAANDYGSLTAQWWTWVYAQPAVDVGAANTNPLIDTTGQFAAAGQENGIGPANKYFFLTGTFGGPLVTRTVTVPHGKALFFPIINNEVDNAVSPVTDYTVPQLRAIVTANIDAATEHTATFDGQPVDVFRSTSPTFDYTVPDEHSIYTYIGAIGPQFEGRIKPAVADGYWSVLPPPTPGTHILTFHSASPGFSLDVAYNLTVL